MKCHIIMDGDGEFRDAGEYAPAQALGRNVTAEAFYHIEPGCRGGREVNMETWVFFQPFLNLRVLVGSVVATH